MRNHVNSTISVWGVHMNLKCAQFSAVYYYNMQSNTKKVVWPEHYNWLESKFLHKISTTVMLQNYQLIIKKLELAETTLKSTRYGKNTYIYAICSADVCRALSTEHLHKTKSKRKKKKEKKEKSKDAQQ